MGKAGAVKAIASSGSLHLRFGLILGALLLSFVASECAHADVCVYKPPKVRQLRGVVTDTSREPIPKVTVSVIANDKVVGTVTTKDDGLFSFSSLADGKYELKITAIGFVPARYQVILGHQTVHWDHAIEINLAVGIDFCGGTIELVREPTPKR